MLKSTKLYLIGCIMGTLLMSACSDTLNPEIYSQTSPDNLFNTVQGVESVLFGAYALAAEVSGNDAAELLGVEESMGDIGYVESTWVVNFQEYILDGAGSPRYSTLWNLPYQAIRNANIILENVNDADIGQDSKILIEAEAKFIRAISYYKLYMRFGEVPLRHSTTQELEIPKASEEDIIKFIETELLASLQGLPNPGEEPSYGRAHKGAALGFLMKLKLNTKEWQEAADYAQKIMDLGVYNLFPDYFSLFFVANERNEELIWVRPVRADLGRSAANSYMNFAYPPGFSHHPRTGLDWPEGARNFDDSNVMVRDSWYDTFDENDTRKDLIVTEYINLNGELINLANNPNNGRRPFKYWPDNDIAGPAYGNDIPVIRYADVLLSRAEALNEIQGPNQESINLINQVRKRANAPEISLSDFGSTAALRDHILNERGWEFWYEGQRRHDLIRHGKLIEKARERGWPAQPHHIRYPIPQFALDANPALEPTEGY